MNAENEALIERMRALREKILAQKAHKKEQNSEKKTRAVGNGKGLDDLLLKMRKKNIGNGKGVDDLLLKAEKK